MQTKTSVHASLCNGEFDPVVRFRHLSAVVAIPAKIAGFAALRDCINGSASVIRS